MEIKGLNAKDEINENDISIETYIWNIKCNLRNTPLEQYADKYCEMIREIYHEIFNNNKDIYIDKGEIGPGTLIHYTPVKDLQTGEVFYDKIESIGKRGLLPVEMMSKDSYARDGMYVSFHRILENEQNIKEVKNRILGFKEGPDKFSPLIFYVDDNKMTRYLKAIARRREEPKGNYLEVFNNSDKETDKLWAIIRNAAVYDPDWLGRKAYFLPIGVPSEFISLIEVPSSLLEDQKLMKILYENFKNAEIVEVNTYNKKFKKGSYDLGDDV